MNAGLDDDESDVLEYKALDMFKSGMPLQAVSITMLLKGECELRDMHRIETFLRAWVETTRKKV